jgi:hypothetical protein
VTKIQFAARSYYLVPATNGYHEALAFRCARIAAADRADIDEAQRFLSLLSFRWGSSLRVVDIMRAGSFVTGACQKILDAFDQQ